MIGGSNKLRFDLFPDPASHFAVSCYRHWSFAGGERVPPAPLGWYSTVFQLWLCQYVFNATAKKHLGISVSVAQLCLKDMIIQGVRNISRQSWFVWFPIRCEIWWWIIDEPTVLQYLSHNHNKVSSLVQQGYLVFRTDCFYFMNN